MEEKGEGKEPNTVDDEKKKYPKSAVDRNPQISSNSLLTLRYMRAGSPCADLLWVINIALPALPMEQSAARAYICSSCEKQETRQCGTMVRRRILTNRLRHVSQSITGVHSTA